MSGARRFEFSRGTSHKFWEIKRDGPHVAVRYGRIGTLGQASTRREKTAEAAAAAVEKLIKEKLRKGYQPALVATGDESTSDDSGARKTAAKRSAVIPPQPAPNLPDEVSTTRPKRSESLLCLSGAGQIPLEFKDALRFADRARHVSVDAITKGLLKLRRIYKLETAGAIPAWVGQLRSLRSLQCQGSFKKLPAVLAALPHLQFLHLDDSALESLEGIERFPALRAVTVGGTPLAEELETFASFAKSIKGAKLDDFLVGLQFTRAARAAPKDRKQLLQALRDDALDDESDLRSSDLSGERFEDLYITHDLRGANLSNTIWLRCDFEGASLAGANLSGATFHDCYFSESSHEDSGNLGKVRARAATWIGCGGELRFRAADLSGARLLDLEPDVALDLGGAKAVALVLEASFASEKEHSVNAKGADLRGAQITFDVTARRRSEIAKKKGSRFAWVKSHLKGAKLDASARVHYVPLDGATPSVTPPRRPGDIDPKGPAAKQLATLHAANASLWAIIADANDATSWRGAVDDGDKNDDFQRALRSKVDAPIAMGAAKGLLAEIGTNGYSPVLAIDGGVMLVDFKVSLDNRKEQCLALARRVAQWTLPMPPKRFGQITMRSGALAILLPYASGAFTRTQLSQAKAGKVYEEPSTHDRLLVPVPNGTYEVAHVPFRPIKGPGSYEDEVGEYGYALVIRKQK